MYTSEASMAMENGVGNDYGSGEWAGWRGTKGEKTATTVIV